jgi:hypothetical protein
MSWNPEMEKSMRLWIRQIVSLSYLYMRASNWSRYAGFTTTTFAVLGTVYTLPGYGCGLVTGQVCEALQWTGIVLGVIVGLNNMLASIYDPGSKKAMFEGASKALLKISRKIDTELAKDDGLRKDAGVFREDVIADYDNIVDHVRLPWFVNGEQQLANISLIQSYSLPEAADLESGTAGSTIQITPADRAVMSQIQHELSRLESSSGV